MVQDSYSTTFFLVCPKHNYDTMRSLLLLVATLLIFSSQSFSQDMNFKNLKLTLAKKAVVVKEENNVIEYELSQVRIYLIADEGANRMRLMAGIMEESKLTKDDLIKVMEANYDRALDAKYAISNDVLWSVFTHPLKELSPEQVIDALIQVKNLVHNYGTTYTSTDLVFGGN